MSLTLAQRTILKSLIRVPLLTEHELANAVSKATQRRVEDVLAEIGKLLTALKMEGLIWSGQLYTKGHQYMWAAALTETGKKVAQNGRESQQASSEDGAETH